MCLVGLTFCLAAPFAVLGGFLISFFISKPAGSDVDLFSCLRLLTRIGGAKIVFLSTSYYYSFIILIVSVH